MFFSFEVKYLAKNAQWRKNLKADLVTSETPEARQFEIVAKDHPSITEARQPILI